MRDLSVLLGKRIRALRTAKGWSQEEFAYECGFHRTYISHAELGRKNVSLHNLITFSTTLGVTLSELFADLEQRAALPGKDEEEPLASVAPAKKKSNRPTAGDVNRLLTELRLQRLTMDRIFATMAPPVNEDIVEKKSQARRAKPGKAPRKGVVLSKS